MTYKHKITGTQAKLAEDGKYYIHNCSIGIPKQLIENHTHWLKEDGFEVLIFKSNRSLSYIPAIQKDGTYLDYPVMHCDGGGATLEWMLKEPEYYIYSVKRLSDNVVFSIGDKVRFSKDYKGFKIEEISLKDNRLELYGQGLFCSVVESNVYKILPVILTTEDNIELFKGDEYYTIYVMDDNRYNTWTTQEKPFIIDASKDAYVHDGVKYFAKKENAETFIKENKPQYSLNDIEDAIRKYKGRQKFPKVNELDILNFLKDE